MIYAGVNKRCALNGPLNYYSLSAWASVWTICHPSCLVGNVNVAIARALANNPAIIMADEPTGIFDSKSTIDVMNIFEAFIMKAVRFF